MTQNAVIAREEIDNQVSTWPAIDEMKKKHMLLLFSSALGSMLNAPCS